MIPLPLSYRTPLLYVAWFTLGAVMLAVIVVIVAVATLHTPQTSRPEPRQPYYRARPGDSLSRIAARTGVPVEQLEQLNPQVDPLALLPGQRVRLRASAPLHPRQARARRRGPLPPYYVIKPGDTLSRVAEKTGVPLYTLMSLNPKLHPDSIFPGHRIKLRR
jgi:LysM repeat protein